MGIGSPLVALPVQKELKFIGQLRETACDGSNSNA